MFEMLLYSMNLIIDWSVCKRVFIKDINYIWSYGGYFVMFFGSVVVIV